MKKDYVKKELRPNRRLFRITQWEGKWNPDVILPIEIKADAEIKVLISSGVDTDTAIYTIQESVNSQYPTLKLIVGKITCEKCLCFSDEKEVVYWREPDFSGYYCAECYKKEWDCVIEMDKFYQENPDGMTGLIKQAEDKQDYEDYVKNCFPNDDKDSGQ